MFKISKNEIVYALPAIILSILLVVVVAFAFTEPSLPPPLGNVPAPLNVGSQGQSKSGGLILNTGGAAIGLIIDKGNVGIGMTPGEYKLDVAGTVQMTGFKLTTGATDGYVLTSDASGLGTWKQGGRGTVTSLSAGTGISLSPNPITVEGIISVNTAAIQSRVSGTCPANQAMRVVNSDGSVGCVVVQPVPCTWGSKTYTTGATCYVGSGSPPSCTSPQIPSGPCEYACKSDGTWGSTGCLGGPMCRVPSAVCGG